MGRIEKALGLLRSDTEVQPSEMAELLIRHGRAAEAVAGMPSLAEQHAADRRHGAATPTDHNWNNPPLWTGRLCRSAPRLKQHQRVMSRRLGRTGSGQSSGGGRADDTGPEPVADTADADEGS
ncbi:hypothetical protein GCM10010478_00420 [Streptomyces erythrogriseus]|uniref:Uncharacterized protein n=1 Tax=Streptomyces erythrogriseus TaxID=284027 RepID=A0ABN3W813_9ACTN